ncbi:MAG TPA: formyltetrahydrofolate deformylase [Treponemataceae bacterium]|nr:formyltetrahydrofolate deformylase [Treponemataceae bacterium]
MTQQTYTLTVLCADQSGLIAAVTGCIAKTGGNILNLAQHTATDLGMFFCRVSFAGTASFTEEQFKETFAKTAEHYSMEWQFFNNTRKKRVAVLVSKTSHCLYEILLKHADEELDCDIPVIISNHPDLAHIATSFHIPFFQVDVAKGKEAYEKDLEVILAQYNIDLIVLARYMQVMTPEFCARWDNKIINIHHGFLPAFKGAKPYHQAWQKGVKIIGATGHFATADLDQGPIIFQDVIRVADTCSVDEFIRMGKDVERRVLVEAVRRYLSHSIFLHGGRTFVIE